MRAPLATSALAFVGRRKLPTCSFIDVEMGVQLGGGRNHSVLNNSFVRCGVAVHLDARGLSSQSSVCAKGREFEQSLSTVSTVADNVEPCE